MHGPHLLAILIAIGLGTHAWHYLIMNDAALQLNVASQLQS